MSDPYETRYRSLIRESVGVLRDDATIPAAMPRHHALHIAHVTGFAGGMIAAGVDPRLAQRVADAEIARYGEDGD